MSDLDDLYHDVIVDHSRHPHNFRAIEDATRTAEGFNPLCGDRVKVFVKLDDDHLGDVSFTGAGCAICTASASMMTQAVKGHSAADVRALFQRFHDLLTKNPAPDPIESDVGKMAALAGVRRFPIRVKCATLAWHALSAALENKSEPVSTE